MVKRKCVERQWSIYVYWLTSTDCIMVNIIYVQELHNKEYCICEKAAIRIPFTMERRPSDDGGTRGPLFSI